MANGAREKVTADVAKARGWFYADCVKGFTARHTNYVGGDVGTVTKTHDFKEGDRVMFHAWRPEGMDVDYHNGEEMESIFVFWEYAGNFVFHFN